MYVNNVRLLCKGKAKIEVTKSNLYDEYTIRLSFPYSEFTTEVIEIVVEDLGLVEDVFGDLSGVAVED
jgi:hypothetical protein